MNSRRQLLWSQISGGGMLVEVRMMMASRRVVDVGVPWGLVRMWGTEEY